MGQEVVGQDVTGAISLGQNVVGQEVSGAGRRGAELRGAGRRWGKISGAGGHGAEGSGAGSGSPIVDLFGKISWLSFTILNMKKLDHGRPDVNQIIKIVVILPLLPLHK